MIWKKYLLKEICKVFFLFLFCFYFLYALIDYSTHMQDFFKDSKIQLGNIALYYYHHFIKRASLLLPIAFLIASIKVLTTFTSRGELTALQMAGLPLTRLLRPFVWIAFFCLVFNFISMQSLAPSSLNFLDRFRESHFKHSYRGNRKEPLREVALKDHSKLVYQTFNPEKNSYFDVVWIQSPNELWRMKYLILSTPPVGQYVDHLERNSEGLFEKTESFPSIPFEKMKWQKDLPTKGLLPWENRPLTELYKVGFSKKGSSSFEIGQAQTYFYHKLLTLFLPLVVIIAIAPICTQYRRTRSLFLIYALSLFGFIAFSTLLNAGIILGESHVISPLVSLVLPFGIATSFFLYRFFRVA